MVSQPNPTITDIEDFSDTHGLGRDPEMALELYRAVFSQDEQSDRFEWRDGGGCFVYGALQTLSLPTPMDMADFVEHLKNLARRAGHADLEMWASYAQVMSRKD